MLANLVVEEEPGGDERVGEDSQDESTGSTSAVPRLNPVAPDEDTLHSSLDGHESPIPPELSASAFSVDSESSNSSADIPLMPRKEPAGTKRKAEVLSKESGKIGVTITTSSPSSGSTSPPPGKLPRLLPLKGSATSPTYNVRKLNCLKLNCPLFKSLLPYCLFITAKMFYTNSKFNFGLLILDPCVKFDYYPREYSRPLKN